MLLPVKATHQGTREHNVRLVMRALAEMGPISRADIARRTRPDPYHRVGRHGRARSRTAWSRRSAEVRRAAARHPSCCGPTRRPAAHRCRTSARARSGAPSSTSPATSATGSELSRSMAVTATRRWSASTSSSTDWCRAAGKPPLGIGIGTSGLVDTSTGHGALGGPPRLARPAPGCPAAGPGPGCPSTSPTTRRPRRWPNGPSGGTPRRAA